MCAASDSNVLLSSSSAIRPLVRCVSLVPLSGGPASTRGTVAHDVKGMLQQWARGRAEPARGRRSLSARAWFTAAPSDHRGAARKLAAIRSKSVAKRAKRFSGNAWRMIVILVRPSTAPRLPRSTRNRSGSERTSTDLARARVASSSTSERGVATPRPIAGADVTAAPAPAPRNAPTTSGAGRARC